MTLQHLSVEEIAAFLDGECTDVEHRVARDHLAECAECQRIADDQAFVKTIMGSLEEPVLPRSFTIIPEMVEPASPLLSPVPATSAKPAGSNLVRFEPFTKFLSIAAVLAFLVLGGAQLVGVGEQTDNNNQSIELTETDSGNDALQEQEPALARGEVREQGESAATNAQPLGSENARVDTQTQVTDSGLTLIELTTIGVGLVALASIAGWILIHYRAGESGKVS